MENRANTYGDMTRQCKLPVDNLETNDPGQVFLIEQTMTSIKSIWERQARAKNLAFETFIEKDFPRSLNFDSLKLQYCLNNLVSNAIKYTFKGQIRILANHFISSKDQRYIVISVQDTGCGMSSDFCEQIFSHNHKLNEGKNIIGVVDTGLPITRELMNELGGKVIAKSQPGKGSTFSLILRINREDILDVTTFNTSRSDKNSGLANINLLVVDDYNLNQLTIKTLLQDKVGKIFIASNGFEALEVLNSCPVDVILMDIHMPVLDGIETTLRIRESTQKWSDVVIIALTADPQYQHIDLCRKIGMNATLSKPIKRNEILNVMRTFFAPARLDKTG
ncbi:MAG TPA: response regulator [Gammaproteobacteria bacterium]|nr:response regulator [Gammaproteobacteria bacterium]